MGSWFECVRSEFRPRMKEFADQPVNYVEIGVWRGSSAHWMLENVLTHKDSRGWGIDPYLAKKGHRTQTEADEIHQFARDRLKVFPNWSLIRETSQFVLRKWAAPIDLLYIDGSHQAHNILADFVLAWPFLRDGAGVIFDDYNTSIRKRFPHVIETVQAVEMCYAGMVRPWPGRRRKKQAAFLVMKDE